ncbi:MAG: branched-chain amino acid ABC transporter permease [Alphaproteobacteria bacterium]
MEFANLIFNGVALGAAYALVALGFVLVLNATAAVNFAQGDLVMAGGFVAVALAGMLGPSLGDAVPGLVLLPLVVIVSALFGLLFAACAYFPFRRKPPVSVFISTIAVGLILQSVANSVFGGAPRTAPPLFAGENLHLAGLTLSRQSLAIVVVAALLIFLLHVLVERTQLGRKLRASAQDAGMARAIGIDVALMVALSFALGVALAGAAGLLLTNQYFVTPTSGINLMVKAYIAVTIGGWGSLRGAVIGALAIALFEVLVGAFTSAAAAEALLYGALLVVLLFRPQGLFGEAAGRRA